MTAFLSLTFPQACNYTPLKQDETAIEAFVLIRLLDAEGHAGWSYRTTNALNREQLLGAVEVQVAVSKKELRDEWDDDEE